MPLIHSSSKKALDQNMKTLHDDIGKSPHVQSRAQAIAIALETQRRAKADGGGVVCETDGGIVPNRAEGGFTMNKQPHLTSSWQTRAQARNLMHTGPVLSAIPGRTDAHQTRVPSGSYVLPSEHVASLGQGNTLAGINILNKMFRQGPYSTSLPHLGHGSGIPKGPQLAKVASGGAAVGDESHIGQPVDVNIAGGEYVISPESIKEHIHPDLDTAHEVLDSWVMQQRKNHIKTLKNLKPPAKD